MKIEPVLVRFEKNAEVVRNLAGSISPDQARWKPAPDKWSLLEVIHHLLDEEREDFRLRLDILLHRPDEPWPPVDPPTWVTERAYNRQDLGRTLRSFLRERRGSLAWLRGLQAPDWNAAYHHPKLGRITAGDLLASWLAHDFLHVRQLAKLHYDYAAKLTKPHSSDYAGSW